jgi:TRAP-type C4-dicarboxylate transport system substrate-binding protein
MNTIARITAALAVCAAAAVVAPAAVAQGTTLTVSSWVPQTHLIMKDIVMPWAAEVEKATEGRVKFRFLPKGVASPIDHFDAVRDGLADVAFISHSYTPQRFPLTRFGVLPFGGKDAESGSVALWRVYDRHFAAVNEHKGVKLLTIYTHGPGLAWNTKKPVQKLEDFGGLKFRVGGGMAADVGTAIGATVIFKPAPESYELLSQGIVDGVFFPGESIISFKLDKLLKHVTDFPGGLYSDSHAVIMSDAKFAALSPADQAAIMKLSGEALSRNAGRAWDRMAAEGWKTVKANNVQITPASPALIASIKEKTRDFEAAWIKEAQAKGADGAKVLAEYRAELLKLEGGK